MRYRYITAKISPDDPISKFRLASQREIGGVAKEVGRTICRVHIPDDLELTKYSSDNYSTTNDSRTIKELGYDILMMMSNGERKILPKNCDVERISKDQVAKWQESLNQNYDSAYHPYPPTQEEINIEKQVAFQTLTRISEINPEVAKGLEETYEKKFGVGWKKTIEAWQPSKEIPKLNVGIER